MRKDPGKRSASASALAEDLRRFQAGEPIAARPVGEKALRFSRLLALAFGALLPVLETVRRWDTWREDPPALFDDWIAGALLLYAAWRTGKDPARGRALLAAAWGFLCGLACSGFLGQVWRLWRGDDSDPAPIPSFWVAVIQGAGLACALLALVLTAGARERAGTVSRIK